MTTDIKKGLIDFGMGVASYLVLDALSKEVNRLEKEGKLNEKEGRKMVKQVSDNYKAASQKYAKQAQSGLDRLVKSGIAASPFATKEEIATLNAKLNKLSRMSGKAKTSKAKKRRKR